MYSTTPSGKFTNKNRLRDPSAYKRVFSSGHHGAVGAFRWFTRTNQAAVPRLGIAAPKRCIKTAVQRNRIKRVIRESFRLNQGRLSDKDVVILVRRSVENEQRLRADLKTIWIKASEIK